MLMGGWGMQRQRHGEQTHWMLVTLASMLGQIGLPGGGFGLSYHYSNGGVPTATGGIIGSITASPSGKAGAKTWLDDTSKSAFPLARISDVLLHPGKKFTITVLKLLTRTLKRYIGRAVIHLFTIKIPIP